MIAAAVVFSIMAGSAVDRLNDFSTQSKLQVLYLFASVESAQTQAVSGDMTPTAALDQLLDGSGLRYEYINNNTVTIVPREILYRQDGIDYDCVPMLPIAGLIFNRLGLLYVDLGLMPADQLYCVHT